MFTLDKLKDGDSAFIKSVHVDGALRRRLTDMGFVSGTEITAVRRAPSGDPVEVSLRGYALTLRRADAEKIEICPTRPIIGTRRWTPPKKAPTPVTETARRRSVRIALVGNQNCGKTTLYNAISGADRLVGNFPGVTVDVGIAAALGVNGCEVVDLPGVYSLSTYSPDEELTRRYILHDHPDAIINVVDATCPERGLYLTTQVLDLNIPTVVAMNMMDEVGRSGGAIDTERLSSMIGVPVIGIAASKNRGINELLTLAVVEAQKRHGVDVSAVPHETERDAAARYAFVDDICAKCVTRRSSKPSSADRFILNRYAAYPLFLAVMACVFYLTFNVIGKYVSEFFSFAVDSLTSFTSAALAGWNVHPVLLSLITDGIFAGVGAVVSFLPLVLTLFFFLSVLEDTGYMARIAFIMDPPMRRLGLSGKSIVPLLCGFGCSVPAVMAARTLPTERDRRITVALVPYMSCSAKIPIYATFAAAFFPDHAAAVTGALYAGGIAVAVAASLLCRRIMRDAPPADYILELPPWRLPTVKGVFRLLRRRAGEFLSRVFGVIFLASVAVWFLSTFDPHLRVTYDEGESILAAAGRLITPIFAPLGFEDWRAAAALLAGLSAKEAVIGTLSVLLGSGAGLESVFTPASAMSFLSFTLLYTPCAAAVAAMKSELGGVKATLRVLICGFGAAWLISAVVYRAALFFL